ncbi:MAG: transposase zinc-binding domain-containing protein [Deltaproteobacteria bacterium]|nr:transposase zinc-binding domain-containing protein [Deltaproteobacteria bacterium]
MSCGGNAAVGVADVLRDHVGGLRLDREQAKTAAHILACRTGRLGGHLSACDRCGRRHFSYHSCRDRHCPRCGSLDQAVWADSLRPFFCGQTRTHALGALFEAVCETTLEASQTRGFRPGILAVLHTWTQKLELHPHVHCLVTL